MNTDKRKSNLFIAAGYFLVAIIILLNYLGQSVKKDYPVAAPARSSSFEARQSAKAPANIDALTRQLNEEKRVNLEMREMIRQMQNSLNSEPHSQAISRNEFLTDASFELPSINSDFESELNRKKNSPFIPNKNPFAQPRKPEDLTAEKNLAPFIGQTLVSDPRLPFFISGANQRTGFKGNF